MKTLKLLVLILSLSSLTALGQGYKIGDIAEDFSLKNVDGKMVSMANYPDAKGFIIIFTCNHCPYSIAYEDRIIALDNEFRPKGYPVIAINPNDPEVEPRDSYEKMQERAAEKKFPFPYLFDEGQKVYPKYGATRTPHVYVVAREKGTLRVKYIGAIDDNSNNPDKVRQPFVKDAVNALIAGKKVPVAETKAIGCTIKKKK